MARKKFPNLSVGRGEKLPVSKGAGLTEKGRAKARAAGSNLKAPTKDASNPRHFCGGEIGVIDQIIDQTEQLIVVHLNSGAVSILIGRETEGVKGLYFHVRKIDSGGKFLRNHLVESEHQYRLILRNELDSVGNSGGLSRPSYSLDNRGTRAVSDKVKDRSLIGGRGESGHR